MPQNLKQTIKKNTTADPKDQDTKDLTPTNRFVKAEEPKKSFEKRAEVAAEKQKLETAKKESLKPEERDWQPLGVIDFSKHDVLHGVGNTRNTRYQMDKQLKTVFNRTTERSNVIKEIGKQISSSGTLTKYSAKKALWSLQKSGKLTQGQVNRTLKHLGM